MSGISKILRFTGNHFSVRTIFKTKHTLCGRLMKTDQVEMPSRWSNVCTVFHALWQMLHWRNKQAFRIMHIQSDARSSQKSKLAQHAYEEGRKIEGLARYTEHHLQEMHGICPHVSGRPSDQSAKLVHLSRHWSGSTASAIIDYIGKLHFYIGTLQMPHLGIVFIFCGILFDN
jgi:hypothetical protein